MSDIEEPEESAPDSWEVTLVKDDVIHTIDGVTGWSFEAIAGSLSLDTEAGARVFVTIASWSVISIEPVREVQVDEDVQSLIEKVSGVSDYARGQTQLTEDESDLHEAFQESNTWHVAYWAWKDQAPIIRQEEMTPSGFIASSAYADAYEQWKATL